MRVILQVMALGFAIAGMGLSASADETTLPSAESATTAAPKAPPELVGKLEGETEIGAAACAR